MFKTIRNWLWQQIVDWLNTEVSKSTTQDTYDFNQLMLDAKPADVILFEGRSRVSEVIKLITSSPWTHAALYIGSVDSIKDTKIRAQVRCFYDGDLTEPLIIESLLGYGTVLNPLSNYRNDHLRVCRASSLPLSDRDKITPLALEHLGIDYDVRQLLDLMRLMFPYGILPKRWRSTLFQHNAGKPTNIVCSSLIARCFQHVHYPILPIIRTDKNDRVRFYKRNFRLFVPGDFDYSPFFDIKKYPSRRFINQFSHNHHSWRELPEQLDKKPISFSLNSLKLPILKIRRQ